MIEAFDAIADKEHSSAMQKAAALWGALLVPEGQKILSLCRAENWRAAFGRRVASALSRSGHHLTPAVRKLAGPPHDCVG